MEFAHKISESVQHTSGSSESIFTLASLSEILLKVREILLQKFNYGKLVSILQDLFSILKFCEIALILFKDGAHVLKK